jgi:hypothetical protein
MNAQDSSDPVDAVESALKRRLAARLSSARRVFIVGVGGGNDSVTSLLLKCQLEEDFGFRPREVDIAAMLPDVLEYDEMENGPHPLVWRILPASRRSAQGTMIRGFPEPLLVTAKHRFGLSEVWGIGMCRGSEGVCEAIRALIQARGYDLVLPCDVGGDFIAAPENLEVLSPMMDAYALHAFQRLSKEPQSPPFVFAVFGLGNDGESTPEMLARALQNVKEYHVGEFDGSVLQDVEVFYRTVVEPNRYSRTADFTLRQIGQRHDPHDNPAKFSARFHTRPSAGSSRSHQGFFAHPFDPSYYGRYYVFDRIDGVRNPFALSCSHGVDWFLKIQCVALRINHELQGQAYRDVRSVLGIPTSDGPLSLYFGTPSRKFPSEVTKRIVEDVVQSVRNRVYDMAFVYRGDLRGQECSDLRQTAVAGELILLAQDLNADVVAELLRLAALESDRACA